MSNDQTNILALILINKKGRLGTADGLCRVLSLFFRILDCAAVIHDLEKSNYIVSQFMDGIKYFKVTPSGQERMNNKKDMIIQILRKTYPDMR